VEACLHPAAIAALLFILLVAQRLVIPAAVLLL
jgi:hypothetical protein